MKQVAILAALLASASAFAPRCVFAIDRRYLGVGSIEIDLLGGHLSSRETSTGRSASWDPTSRRMRALRRTGGYPVLEVDVV
jgi:hypothetical protein